LQDCYPEIFPTPQEYVAVQDSFGESGKPDELLIKYGLGIENVINAVKRF
jgi:transketolase